MVEGPSAKALSLRIEQELRGDEVTHLYIKPGRCHITPRLAVGCRIEGAESIGKNILVKLQSLGLRIHLMMYGRLYLQSLNEPLTKPERRLRLLLETPSRRLAVFNTPIVELDYFNDLKERLLKELGPDPLRPEWDLFEAAKRILNHGGKVGVAILDQKVIAGVGNIIRNEVLFRVGMHPERPTCSLSFSEAFGLAREVEVFSREFYERKVRGLRVGELFKVYNRAGKPCPACGSPVRMYIQQPIGRRTFICERCQR